MTSRTYDRLPVEDFGRKLIVSGDLDPIYSGLVGAYFEDDQLKRWLLSYFLLYHAGVASWLSECEGDEYWKWLLVAAHNTEAAPTGLRWPRSAERRHWRGAQAVRSATELRDRYKRPEEFVDYVSQPTTFDDVTKRVKEHRGFGSWVSFKVVDMLICCLGRDIDVSESEVFMYTDPVKGALMVWRSHMGVSDNIRPKSQATVISGVVNHLTVEFSDLKAPPKYDRPVGVMEVETVLCKWKSHMHGRYPLLNDTIEIHDGLVPWLEHSETAIAFKDALPKKPKHEETS